MRQILLFESLSRFYNMRMQSQDVHFTPLKIFWHVKHVFATCSPFANVWPFFESIPQDVSLVNVSGHILTKRSAIFFLICHLYSAKNWTRFLIKVSNLRKSISLQYDSPFATIIKIALLRLRRPRLHEVDDLESLLCVFVVDESVYSKQFSDRCKIIATMAS